MALGNAELIAIQNSIREDLENEYKRNKGSLPNQPEHKYTPNDGRIRPKTPFKQMTGREYMSYLNAHGQGSF